MGYRRVQRFIENIRGIMLDLPHPRPGASAHIFRLKAAVSIFLGCQIVTPELPSEMLTCTKI